MKARTPQQQFGKMAGSMLNSTAVHSANASVTLVNTKQFKN